MHQLRQCILFRSAVLAMREKVYQWSYQNLEKRKDGNTLGLSAVKYMVYFSVKVSCAAIRSQRTKTVERRRIVEPNPPALVDRTKTLITESLALSCSRFLLHYPVRSGLRMWPRSPAHPPSQSPSLLRGLSAFVLLRDDSLRKRIEISISLPK